MVAYSGLLMALSCGLVGVPSAEVQGMGLTRLGYRQADAVVTVGLHNPLWVDGHVTELRWSLEVAGHPVATGQTAQAIVLAAQKTTSASVPVVIRYADVMSAAGASMTEEGVPYSVTVEMDTVTPSGLVTMPLVYEGTLPALRPPSLDLIGVGWEVEPDGRLRLDLTLGLSLPEGFRASQIDWSIEVDDRPMAHGSAAATDDGTLTFPAWLDGSGLVDASWSYLWGRAHRLELAVDGRVETPWGEIPLHTESRVDLANYGAFETQD